MTNLSPLFTWRGAIAGSSLPPTTTLVAYALSLHMNERGGSCFPSQTTLQAETRLSERAVRDHLHALVEQGWLTRKRRAGKSDLFEATIPTPAPAAGVPRHVLPFTPAPPAPEDVKRALEGSTAAQSHPRARDEIYEALAVEFGAPATRNERSKRNGVVKQLKEAGAAPWEVVDRARRFAQRFDGATCTDTALMNHWGALAPNGGKPAVPPCSSCGVGQGLHAADCNRLHMALAKGAASESRVSSGSV